MNQLPNSLLFSLIILLFTIPFANAQEQVRPEECLIKSSSEWGSSCSACTNSTETYRINLRNQCEISLDVIVAVKEKNGRWRTFRRNELAAGDSISAYACQGAGKYQYWCRAAGDKQVILPTDEEIQKQLSEIK